MSVEILNITTYPELEAFINSEQPNIETSEYRNKSYNVRLSNDGYYRDMSLFEVACLYGKLDHIHALYHDKEEMKKAIGANNYKSFQFSAKNGHTTTLQYLETHLTEEEKREAVRADNYAAICNAAENGFTETLRQLETHLTDVEKNDAAKANEYKAIRNAAKNGFTETLRQLETHLTDIEKNDAVKANKYEAIRLAALYGHTAIIKYLETHLTDAEKVDAVKSDRYAAIIAAGRNGHTTTIQYLEANLTDAEKIQAAICAIPSAAYNGHTPTIQYLETHLTDDQKSKAVYQERGKAIIFAAYHGHTATIQYLETHLTDNAKNAIVRSMNYEAIRSAAKYGHTATLQHLETHLGPEEKREMIEFDNYEVIHSTASRGFNETLQHLFKIDVALAHAEMHVQEYGHFVLPYVQQKLASLRADKTALEIANPNAVFNVSEEEARCLYYMARHLIRLNPTVYRDDLLFLLELPQVRQLAHRNPNDGQENELLRLAQATGNQTAAQLLLAIPAVNALARAHNYYQTESRGELDLRALAANRESSMAALTRGEQQRLAQVIEHYEPFVKSADVSNIIHDLRETLKGRYQDRPAEIQKDNGEIISLPLESFKFKQLQLSDNEKKRALEAYYKNKDHTALRYVLESSSEASLVHMEDTQTQRSSSFEAYELLIALLYCAARDEHTPATDGFTLDARLEHFIDELAHIKRAHNWDRTRQNANGKSEDYDDLEIDKPSCFTGTKRRLFQSVLGHPLLTILSEEMVLDEMSQFVQAHFLSTLTKANREAVFEALSKVTASEDLTEENKRALAQTDIPKEKYDRFIELMNQKYGIQFNSEPKFLDLIQKAMRDKPEYGAHILNFSRVIQSLLQSAELSSELNGDAGLLPASAGENEPVHDNGDKPHKEKLQDLKKSGDKLPTETATKNPSPPKM